MKKSKKLWAKCSPISAPLQPPLWGWVMGSRVSTESHPHRSTRTRSSNALLLQFLYIWGKKPHLLPCGSISFTLTKRSVVLVPSLFQSSAVVNLHFWVQFPQECWARAIFDIFELEIVYNLNFLITIDFRWLWTLCTEFSETLLKVPSYRAYQSMIT